MVLVWKGSGFRLEEFWFPSGRVLVLGWTRQIFQSNPILHTQLCFIWFLFTAEQHISIQKPDCDCILHSSKDLMMSSSSFLEHEMELRPCSLEPNQSHTLYPIDDVLKTYRCQKSHL